MARNGMSLACAVSSRRLAGDPDLRDDHIGSCLSCQVEAVRYRTLRRQLAMLRPQLIGAPAGLPALVRSSLGSEAAMPNKQSGRETVVAAAGLAAVAGAVALWRRSLSA